MVQKIRCEDEIVGNLAGLDEITRPIHNLRLVEARVTFWSAIALLGIGTLILIIGAFGSGTQMQSAKLGAGALLNLIGGVILKLHRDVHAKLDRFHRDRDQIHMILQIADRDARDRAIEEFARSLQDEKAGWWKRLAGR
jgi:uncharacterized membrane protein YraQ (UPF0718 family)